MTVGEAWKILGFDAQEIINRLGKFPRNQRVRAVQQAFEEAKKAAKKLLAINHPDRGGDPKKFIQIQRALQSLEIHTEEFTRKMSDIDRNNKEIMSKRPIIKLD